MAVQNVFIAGMEKCGTTALSEWMVNSGLAEDRVPGIKEPYLYANDMPHPARMPGSGLPLLDASVGYAMNAAVVRRLPEYDTRLVLCLRNQFERTWSSYKMKKLMASGGREVEQYFSSYERGVANAVPHGDRPDEDLHRITRTFFPRRSHSFVERYELKELEHVRTHDFAARIEYELAFYLSRRTLPFVSILGASFYYLPLRHLLEKYQASDVSVLSVERLGDAQARRRFVAGVFEKDADTPEVPFKFSSSKVDFEEAKPDFNDKAFDLLRACFRYDLAQARALIPLTRFGDSLLDNAELDRYLEAR
ncbi:hypothetical protein [Massilia agri]|uniref:Sulfotransferase family protein n=1 Tax=Massilia agri TaxID=1886785 RepID=A0ABT2AI60_9BURK|nr:hypothetical protein [Massilia agri]MCS0595922.1 hypothetical protein [Massilia agri]